MTTESVAVTELVPGSEFAIGLVAVPAVKLEMKLSGEPKLVKVEVNSPKGKSTRLQLDVAFSGTGQHLPDKLTCNLACEVTRDLMGAQKVAHRYEAGSFPLEKGSDGKYSLSAKVDVLTGGLLGKGVLALSLAPVFPHAPVVKVERTYAFDLPMELAFKGLEGALAKPPSKVPQIGDNVTLVPKVASQLAELPGFAMRLTLVETVERFAQASPGSTANRQSTSTTAARSVDETQKESVIEVLVWNGEVGRRGWRVGTSRSDNYRFLTCYKPGEHGDYEVEARLDVSLDNGGTYERVWSLPGLSVTFPVRRPTLTSFTASVRAAQALRDAANNAVHAMTSGQLALLPPEVRREVVVTGKMEGFSADLGLLRWNLLVTIWGARPIAPPVPPPPPPASTTKAKTPAAKPLPPVAPAKLQFAVEPVATVSTPLLSEGRFELIYGLNQLPADEWASLACYPLYFATLSIDPQALNSPTPQPIVDIINVDEQRFPLANPEDLLEKATRATALEACCENLPGELVCVPHVGSIRFAIEGEKLVVRFHLVGSLDYWKKAKVAFSLLVDTESELPTELSLNVTTPQDAPHLRVASLDMTSKDLLGRRVDAVARVSAPSLHDARERLTCVPSIEGPLSYHASEDGARRFFCSTHYIPTFAGKKASTKCALRFTFYEELLNEEGGKRRRLPLGYITPKHDLPVGAAGLCSPSGLFAARLPDARLLDEAMKKGRVVLVAEVAAEDRRLFGLPVESVELVLPGTASPRRLKNVLRFGKCVSASFKRKVIELAAQLTTPACRDHEVVANYLMTIMACETGGSFSATAENQISHAIGLIQFIVKGDLGIQGLARDGAAAIARLTAAGADTPDKREAAFKLELRAMSAEAQLDIVRNYLLRAIQANPSAASLDDYYCYVFMPKAVGTADDFVLGAPGSREALSNPSLCVNGSLLKVNVTKRIREWWAFGERYCADEADDTVVAYSPEPSAK